MHHRGYAHHAQGTSAAEDKHAGHRMEDFLRRFWIVLALTVPIILLSDLPHALFGTPMLSFAGSSYFSLALGTIVYFYGGLVFLRGAVRELRARLPGMMTLIALAITTAYLYSVGVTVWGSGMTLFWELATLIAVMLLGHYVEMRAVMGASGALDELAKLLPDTAEVIRSGTIETVPLAQVRVGDVVIVRPGGKVPTDGEIIEGESELDESIITGESRAVEKRVHDRVITGSINGDGTLQVRVMQIGEETFLAGIMRLVAQAQSSKSRLQLLSDRAALWLTIIAVVAGAVTFTAWLAVGASAGTAVERLVAVLVIACPHALGLAIPLVAAISTTMAARSGLLVKERLALEAARGVDVVLFDKTGTLTHGSFGVDTVVPASGWTRSQVLQIAASLNNASEHALARAMVVQAQSLGMLLDPVAQFERIAGRGARGIVRGKHVAAGNDTLLAEHGIMLSDEHHAQVEELARQGKTVVHVIVDGALAGTIALADVIRDEAREAVAALKKMRIRIAMITGDSADVAAWVAGELGIDEYFAGVLPQDKADKVRLLQGKGARVAMVGDGVNDAPALATADVGIAIGAGTNVAIESAGIILVRDDPRDIVKIIRLSRLTYAKMLQNLFWATAYNIVALPIAAGALAPQGIVLGPAVAAIFMSLSTVIVAVNAALLGRRSLDA